MNNKLTKAQVVKMTTEELQAAKNDFAAALATDMNDTDRNLINGSLGLVDVELRRRQPKETIVVHVPDDLVPTVTPDKNGEGSIVDYTDADKEQAEFDASPSVRQTPAVLDNVLEQIAVVLAQPETANTRLARIMKLAEHNVDYTELPYELCTDAELMRRLKLLWSKRVAAKKAGDFATLEDIDKQEAEINSFRTAKVTRTGTVSSDNVDHSKLTQVDLQKLIRNYQSKKSSAKKLYEAAVASNDEKLAEEQKNLMEHWQAKVDDASKYRTGSTNQRSAELTKQIQDTVAMLKMLPQSDEIAAKIKELEALL